MNFIKANLDNTVQIKEIDQYCIHVRLTRRVLKPGQLDADISYQVKCFPVSTFEKMEALRTSKNPIVWYRAGGFTEARIVHDGRLQPKPEVKTVTDEEITAKKKADSEARKKATRLANLVAARAAKQAKT
jgi:hypothetical protein